MELEISLILSSMAFVLELVLQLWDDEFLYFLRDSAIH